VVKRSTINKKSGKNSKIITIKINTAVFLFVVAIAALGFFFQNLTTNTTAPVSVPTQEDNKIIDNGTRQANQGTKISNLLPSKEEVRGKTFSYQFDSKSKSPTLNIGEKTTLSLSLRNTGNVSWISNDEGMFFLGTSHEDDRKSVFFKDGEKGWVGANRIMMDKPVVKPGQTASFTFEITAPNKSGIYREFFKPLVEGFKWLDDKNIFWDITVRDPKNKNEQLVITVDGNPVKYIKVNLSQQRLYAYENGVARYVFITSTGMSGMDTPTGNFQIYNKFPVQYSPEYQLYMDNWMAFTPSGSHGIHSLPYWVYKNGAHVYEGEGHLGTPVSHGCIRVSLENSKILYDWAEVGTKVIVEK